MAMAWKDCSPTGRTMARSEDEDTKPLRPPETSTSPGESPRDDPEGGAHESHEPSRPVERWHLRTFEFASPEAALLFAACTVAVGVTADVWPVLELSRRRARLRLRTGLEATPLERAVWAELMEWARRLGARDVTEHASGLE
jgi:hypothetical protein